MSTSQNKDTNPKDAVATNRVPLHLLSPTSMAWASIAMMEGALKYGSWNYRVKGIKSSVYVGAALRHLLKYFHGEWADPTTHVPHLASVLACANILLDAHSINKVVDDRPPIVPDLTLHYQKMECTIAHLRKLFGNHKPKHYVQREMDHVTKSE